MAYSVVRVSEDYKVVILAYAVEGEPAPDNAATEYFQYNARYVIDSQVEAADAGDPLAVFARISMIKAIGYLGGVADGLGFGERPEERLEDIVAVWRWVRYKQKEYLQLWKELRPETPLPASFYVAFPDNVPDPREPRYILQYGAPGAAFPHRMHLPVKNDEQARGAFAVAGAVLQVSGVRLMPESKAQLFRVMNDGTWTEIA